jgi:hypothetical protein
MSETQEVKYSSYTPAQKKASQLYRLKNKDKINEQRKKYYLSRKELDPKFLEYKRMKAKEYYEKKKLDKVVNPDVEMKEASTQVEVPDVIMNEPVLVPEMVQETKMEIDSPEISVPMTNPLKGKRMTKSKKLKTELVVKV